jgi:multicomponent Na+:H+ antiporter subunit G
MAPFDLLTVLLSLMGTIFFLAGSVGLLRFPNVYLRIHAITKADNLGLGLIILALMLQAGSIFAVGKLLLIWLLALLLSANSGFMIGRWTLRHEKRR